MQGGVRKKGNRWYYYFEIAAIEGKRKKVERAGGATKKEALTALRKAISEYESCGNIKNDSEMSFHDFMLFYLNTYINTNCKRTTYNLYKGYIDRNINVSLGTFKLKNVTPVVLQDFLNSLTLRGFTKNTVSNFYGILSGALKYAVYPCNYIKENPMQYVKMPRYDTVRITKDSMKIIKLQDFNTIIERFPFKESNFFLPLQIAFHTGLRASEVCGLTWDDIDFNLSTLSVNKILVKPDMEWIYTSPKTSSSYRTISIGKTLLNILKQQKLFQTEMNLKYGPYYKKSNAICTKENGELITTQSLKYLSRVINYELKINFNFHSLRHTHATMLIEASANMKDVQERLGHSKLATTMDTYAHVTEKMKKDTVDIFENIIIN